MNTNSKQQYRTIGLSFIGLAMLSLAVVPFTAYAAEETATTTINSTVGSVISLASTSGTVTLNATPTGSGVQTTAKDIVTVSTNNAAGYTLKLNDTAAPNTLVSGGNSIAAASGTFATPLALTANTWGYRVDGAGTFGATPTTASSNQPISAVKYAGVPISPDTLKATATTATNNTTDVWYSVAVNTSQPTGTYTGDVTYTVTTN